jgi:long-chain acyl-CoA synthetase
VPDGRHSAHHQVAGLARTETGEHAHFSHDDGLHVDYARLLESGEPYAPVEVLPGDIAVLQYTGGTTGTPKGAMLTHANLTANAVQQRAHIGKGLKGPQRTLAVLPMFHVFALTAVLNFSIEVAAELVLLPRFEMKQFLDTIKRKPPSLFFGVPTIFIAMNALPREQQPDLSGLRACVSGGAPLPLDVRLTFEELMGARVCEGYGLTEASPIIACNPVDGVIKENSCGIRFPGTVIEIRDLDDPTRIMPTGERGEICARGPQVMAGYWKNPEETAKAFVDGALRTGDIGYLDEDGYLFIVDRIKDMILCGGYNVYPRVIEEAAYRHPAIEEAIAIAIPDQYRGQSPKLFVKLHEGQEVTTQEISAFLKDWLNKIEMPKEIEIRESLPKTLIGKLSKKELVAEEKAKRDAA